MAMTVRLPVDLDERLQSFCQSQGAVKNRVVVMAVRAYLDGEESTGKTVVSAPSEPVFKPGPPFVLPAVTVAAENVTPALGKNLGRVDVCVHHRLPAIYCDVCDVEL